MNRREFLQAAAALSLVGQAGRAARAQATVAPRFLFIVEGNGVEPASMLCDSARAALDASLRSPVGTARWWYGQYRHTTPLIVPSPDLAQSQYLQTQFGTAFPLEPLATEGVAGDATVILGLSSRIVGGGHVGLHGALSSTRSNGGLPGGPTIDAYLAALPQVRGQLPFDAFRVGVGNGSSIDFGTCAFARGRPAPMIRDLSSAYAYAYSAFTTGASRVSFDRQVRMLEFASRDVTAAQGQFTGSAKEATKLDSYAQAIRDLQLSQTRLQLMSVTAPPAPAAGLSGLPAFEAALSLATSTLIDGLTPVAVVGSGSGGDFSLTYDTISPVSRHNMQHGSGADPVMLDAIRQVNRAQVASIARAARSNAVRDFKKARVQGSSEDGVVDQATVKSLFPEGAAKAPAPTPKEEVVKGAKGRKPKTAASGTDEPYLPVIKDFKPGLYERGTREVQVAQQRLEKQIENAATPEEKAKLEAQQKQWEACSFHTTRRAAQLSGSSYGKILEETGDPTGQARPGFGAWHKRGVVLKNGGEDVWDKKSGKLDDAYSQMQVGDFVSIGNGGMNKAAERYPDLAFEEGARHSGIIIGKTEQGVPIVEHDVHGKVYREPIDDLSAAHMGYSALSVFRAEPFKNTRAIKAKADAVEAQQQARAGWTGADPFTSEVKLEDPQERAAANRYVAAYQDLREELGVQYGVTPEHLDRSFRDVMAIGVQESNFDNQIVRTSKSSTTAQLGDEAKQWLTGESKSPLHNVVRDGLRWGRDLLDTVTASEAKDNAAYNQEHGLKPNVPAWQKEIEIAGLMKTQPGLNYEDAAKQVNAQYGKSEQAYHPLALRSHGTFKVKEVPEKAEIALDGALNGEENYGLGMSRFFHSDRGNLIAGLATYEQNYAKAREAFPPSSIAKDLGWNADQLDDFYRQVAMLAHNAPSKAFNRDFVNFYVAPIASGKADDPNPDRDRFGVDYNRQVAKFRQELWGT